MGLNAKQQHYYWMGKLQGSSLNIQNNKTATTHWPQIPQNEINSQTILWLQELYKICVPGRNVLFTGKEGKSLERRFGYSYFTLMVNAYIVLMDLLDQSWIIIDNVWNKVAIKD